MDFWTFLDKHSEGVAVTILLLAFLWVVSKSEVSSVRNDDDDLDP